MDLDRFVVSSARSDRPIAESVTSLGRADQSIAESVTSLDRPDQSIADPISSFIRPISLLAGLLARLREATRRGLGKLSRRAAQPDEIAGGEGGATSNG